MRFSVQVGGEEAFKLAFRKVEDDIKDFRPTGVWEAAARAFFEIESDLFQSDGARGASGAWPERSEAYQARMEREGDSPLFMPILQRERILYFSLTRKGAPEQVYDEQAQELTIGTTRKGAAAHMKPYKGRPARKPIDMTEKDRKKLQSVMKKKLAANVRKTGIETELPDEGDF